MWRLHEEGNNSFSLSNVAARPQLEKPGVPRTVKMIILQTKAKGYPHLLDDGCNVTYLRLAATNPKPSTLYNPLVVSIFFSIIPK